MRFRPRVSQAALALVLVLACRGRDAPAVDPGGAGIDAAAPGPVAPSITPLAATPVDGWTWTAAMSGPWRMPSATSGAVWSLGMVDRDRALVGDASDAMFILDLRTGRLGPPTPVMPPDTGLHALARLGDRLVGLGQRGWDTAQRAWEITVDPKVRAIPIAVPDRGEPNPGKMYAFGSTSPSGSRVVVCDYGRWPTVRTAASLAIVGEAVGVECLDPQFTDDDHLHFAAADGGWRSFDVATGVVGVHAASEPRVFVGPGGRQLVRGPGGASLLGGPRVHDDPPMRHVRLAWAPDGTAVEVGDGLLVIHPADGGPDHRVVLPEELTNPLETLLVVDARRAVWASAYTIVAVDLADGAVHAGEGSLRSRLVVGPRAGSVVIGSDRIREYRDGALRRTSGTAIDRLVADPATAPVVAIAGGRLVEWDPATDRSRALGAVHGATHALARAGEVLAYDDGDAVFVSRGGAPPARWFGVRSGLALESIDLDNQRFAWSDGEDAYRIVALGDREAWTLRVPYAGTCRTGSAIRLGRGTTLAAVQDDLGIELYDLAARASLGGAELIDAGGPWDLVPGTSDVIAADGDRVVLWTRGERVARVWRTHTGRRWPVDLAIDAAGGEVAIGYDDGTIVWARIAELRAHAAAAPVVVHPPGHRCGAAAGGGSAALGFDDLVDGVGGG